MNPVISRFQAGLILPVAVLGDLIALKVLSAGEPGREHDWRDLRALIAQASRGDLKIARSAIALLEARGQNPGGCLGSRLEDLLESVEVSPFDASSA